MTTPRRIYSYVWRFTFCSLWAVVPAKNGGVGCQTGAPAKGFAKRSIEPLLPPCFFSLMGGMKGRTITPRFRKIYLLISVLLAIVSLLISQRSPFSYNQAT